MTKPLPRIDAVRLRADVPGRPDITRIMVQCPGRGLVLGIDDAAALRNALNRALARAKVIQRMIDRGDE
jgi:hypothetical protein